MIEWDRETIRFDLDQHEPSPKAFIARSPPSKKEKKKKGQCHSPKLADRTRNS